MILDVGCGNRKPDGAFGIDKRLGPSVDSAVDIEVIPWPFDGAAFSGIRFHHVLEHIKPWLMVDVMNEAWRVISPGSVAIVDMPYPGSPRFWQDPTHIKAWNEVTPRYFDPDYPNWYDVYQPKPWKILECRFDREGDIHIILERRP